MFLCLQLISVYPMFHSLGTPDLNNKTCS